MMNDMDQCIWIFHYWICLLNLMVWMNNEYVIWMMYVSKWMMRMDQCMSLFNSIMNDEDGPSTAWNWLAHTWWLASLCHRWSTTPREVVASGSRKLSRRLWCPPLMYQDDSYALPWCITLNCKLLCEISKCQHWATAHNLFDALKSLLCLICPLKHPLCQIGEGSC